MPRKRRFHGPGMPAHVVKRGNNRPPCFFDDNGYLPHLDWLLGKPLDGTAAE